MLLCTLGVPSKNVRFLCSERRRGNEWTLPHGEMPVWNSKWAKAWCRNEQTCGGQLDVMYVPLRIWGKLQGILRGSDPAHVINVDPAYDRLSAYFLHLHTALPGRVTSPILKMRKENWGSGKFSCIRESIGYCLPALCAKRTCPQMLLPVPPYSKARAVSSSGYIPSTPLLMAYSSPAHLVTQLTGSNMNYKMRALSREGNNTILDLHVRKTYLIEGHRY